MNEEEEQYTCNNDENDARCLRQKVTAVDTGGVGGSKHYFSVRKSLRIRHVVNVAVVARVDSCACGPFFFADYFTMFVDTTIFPTVVPLWNSRSAAGKSVNLGHVFPT